MRGALLAVLAIVLATPASVAGVAPTAAQGVGITVRSVNANTGKPIPGVCYSVEDLTLGGPFVATPCGDADGIGQTGPLTPGHRYRIGLDQTGLGDYIIAPMRDAYPGSTVTMRHPPKPRLRIKTVDAKSGKKLRDACYSIDDLTHGGSVGTFCDGSRFDADGADNGTIVTAPFLPNTKYRLTERVAPAGHDAASGEIDVVTVAGKDAKLTVKNARSG